jgi:hypothetical protein
VQLLVGWQSCKAAGRRRRTLEEVAELLPSAMVKGGREWRRLGLGCPAAGRGSQWFHEKTM